MALRVDIEESDGRCLIRVEGEVDLYSSPELRKAVTRALTRASAAVGVDLSAVAYMDSSGVATLIEGLREAGKGAVEFLLVAPSPPVMKVLQLSRLDTVFAIRGEWPPCA